MVLGGRMVAAWLVLAGMAGCSRHRVEDVRTAEVTERVRAAYGGMVRSVTRVASAATTIPPCPREAEGMGDAGYVLVIEDRTVTAQEAVVLARALCRRSRPNRAGTQVAWLLERFTLERRGAAWQVVSRDLLEDRTR